MNQELVTKERLNSYTHIVRASQAVLQYGVGAMVDFPNQTLMTAAPEYWAENIVEINDERLEKLLGVDYFGMPAGKDIAQEGISYARFPSWYFCPKCRKFQTLEKWTKEFQIKDKKKAEDDYYMTKHIKCTTCYQNLVVSRIVVACRRGHIDDFPWVEWAHRKNMSGEKKECSKPDLRFKTGTSSSEGLEGLIITCETCKAKASLREAFNPGIFESLTEKSSENRWDFSCRGFHPWKNEFENCDEYPKAMQRGSSSIYYPVTASSLVIPPYSDKFISKIEASETFKNYRSVLAQIPQELRESVIKEQLVSWVSDISNAVAVPKEFVKEVLKRKWLDEQDEEYSTLSVKYRSEEYDALNGKVEITGNQTLDFAIEEMNINEYKVPLVNKITLIHKVREVQALLGFSRIDPIEKMSDYKSNDTFVSIKGKRTRWYPACEVRGEGIFLEFDQNQIEEWIKGNSSLRNRMDEINQKYNQSYSGKQYPRRITAKFLLLHTLSHLLIKQLSFECGYSVASLKERIYCSEEDDGKRMAGILIYTSSGDSEGTLGGLVRQGRADSFSRIYQKALFSSMSCSNDPVCILSNGQGRDALNLASCHACTLLPETCCEEYNILLDRAVISGTFNNKKLGIFSDFLYEHKWVYEKNKVVPSEVPVRKKAVFFLSSEGISLQDYEYHEIWEILLGEAKEPNSRIFFDNAIKKNELFYDCEKPTIDGTIKDLDTGEEVQVNLIWKEAKILFWDSGDTSDLDYGKISGWRSINISNSDITPEMLSKLIRERS
ncbi:DUF1998 domain-containing protein [uncultured Vagococcus sp.]|uniref:DUF1998 domain-containing protein n=1 Tax=uncultured Vagococcus sp. TaxID=189676 RepID=UPI0028D0791F|nr:DUF1998 domain-containing protein [uncultured Vagococcus sp.]